jgi:hypothetical protein
MIGYKELSKKFLAGSTPILVKIEHPDLENPIYLTDNNKSIDYEGNAYIPTTMTAKLPENSSETNANATITLSAIDQRMTELVRSISTPPTLTIIACYYSNGIISKLDGYQFSLTNITIDAISMTADLINDFALEYSFPNGESTSITTPGIV